MDSELQATSSDTSSSSTKGRGWAFSVGGFVLMLSSSVFPCLCGHLGSEALPITAGAAVFAVYGWLSSTKRWPYRLIEITIAIPAVLLLAKNLGDVLWWGHDPLFPQSP